MDKKEKIKKEIIVKKSTLLNSPPITQIPVEVYTAVKIKDGLIAKIKKAVDQVTGQDAKIKIIVDKSILGGLIVKIDYSIIDLSIKRKLDNLKILLKDLDLRGKEFEAEN